MRNEDPSEKFTPSPKKVLVTVLTPTEPNPEKGTFYLGERGIFYVMPMLYHNKLKYVYFESYFILSSFNYYYNSLEKNKNK